MHSLLGIAVRCAVLCFSMYGYLRALCNRMRPEFTLAVAFSSIGSVMFFAGILNALREAAVIIAAGGLLLGVRSLRRKESPKILITPGTLFLAAMCAYMVFVLHGATFSNYDDFSHWATVVKVMLRENRFPNFQDSIIMFQSYPTGTASFLYFFLKVTGLWAEWFQMCLQAALAISMVVPLFAFAEGLPGNCCAAVGAVMLLCGIIAPNKLAVDTILALTAIAAAAIFFSIRRSSTSSGNYSPLLPLTVFLMATKNSGAIFVVMILCLLLFLGGLHRAPKQLAIQAAAPFATLFLWQKHVRLVFTHGLTAKHSMSLENMVKSIQKKSLDDIISISRVFLQRVISFGNHFFWLAALFLLIWFLLHRSGAVGDALIPRVGILGACFYIAYLAGLWGMYLFSMPVGEARRLASFPRYHNTMLLFLVGMLFIFYLPHIRLRDGRRALPWALAAVLVLAAQVCVPPHYNYYDHAAMAKASARTDLENTLRECGLVEGDSCLIITDGSYGYYQFMLRYFLYSGSCHALSGKNTNKILQMWPSHKYVLLYDASEETCAWAAEVFGTSERLIVTAAVS